MFFPLGEFGFCVTSPKLSAFCREASITGAYHVFTEHVEENQVQNYLFPLSQAECSGNREARHFKCQDSKHLHFKYLNEGQVFVVGLAPGVI